MFDQKNCDILLLLKSLGVNFPVLKFWGLKLAKLLLVIVDPGQGESVANILSDGDAPVIDEFMGKRDLKRVWAGVNSNFVIFRYKPSRKANDLLDDLASIAQNGSFAGIPTMGVPIAIAEGIPLGFEREKAFTVFLEGDLLTMDSISLEEVVPPDDQLQVIKNRSGSCMQVIRTRDEAALIGAACFLYPLFPVEERDQTLETYLAMARSLADINEESQFSEGIEELALQEFFRWREETDFSEVCELPYLEVEEKWELSGKIMYDDEHVWLSEKLFKRAMATLVNVFPISVIKESLVKSGVILRETGGTYEVKMGFYNSERKYQRAWMLRLNRDKLTRLGELGFVEQCLDAKGENNET